jgi:hypothetical protein
MRSISLKYKELGRSPIIAFKEADLSQGYSWVLDRGYGIDGLSA